MPSCVFESQHVVRIEGNGARVLAGRKEILRQIDASHVVVMRTSREQVQYPLILTAISHQIVQHQQPRTLMGREQRLKALSLWPSLPRSASAPLLSNSHDWRRK